jgi:predicted anti-sigma-YlaC factor YlaD
MELTCAEVRRELSNYIEDDVTPALRARIEEHVRSCRGCRALYDGVKNIITLVGHSEIIELPVGFSRRLLTRLSSKLN